MHALVAFLGVFLASFCFFRSSRLAGAIFLLIIGVGGFYFELVFIVVEPDRLRDGWARVAYIFVGATMAVASHAVWPLLFRKRT